MRTRKSIASTAIRGVAPNRSHRSDERARDIASATILRLTVYVVNVKEY